MHSGTVAVEAHVQLCESLQNCTLRGWHATDRRVQRQQDPQHLT
jgi:hypothetical protein